MINMSELKEECYKCLNKQKCISGADYGSIYCMLNRKFDMTKDSHTKMNYCPACGRKLGD